MSSSDLNSNDKEDDSSTLSSESSTDVCFDGPMGQAIVSIIDKKTGKIVESYNQKSISLTGSNNSVISISSTDSSIQILDTKSPISVSSTSSTEIQFE